VYEDPEAVTFAWRVTNANYVLIKGYDQKRHPLTGTFDRPSGGAFTFVAIGGTEIVRKPWMCVPTRQPGFSLDWGIEQDAEALFSFRSEGLDIKVTTPLSRDQIETLLINLARTNYGVVLEPKHASTENIFLVTKTYGVCQFGPCKNGSGLLRQFGFDIIAERESHEKNKTSYTIHVTGEVLSKPAGKIGNSNLDLDSKEIALLMLKKLTDDIINQVNRETGNL
jgi:hypothetical protein